MLTQSSLFVFITVANCNEFDKIDVCKVKNKIDLTFINGTLDYKRTTYAISTFV